MPFYIPPPPNAWNLMWCLKTLLMAYCWSFADSRRGNNIFPKERQETKVDDTMMFSGRFPIRNNSVYIDWHKLFRGGTCALFCRSWGYLAILTLLQIHWKWICSSVLRCQVFLPEYTSPLLVSLFQSEAYGPKIALFLICFLEFRSIKTLEIKLVSQFSWKNPWYFESLHLAWSMMAYFPLLRSILKKGVCLSEDVLSQDNLKDPV